VAAGTPRASLGWDPVRNNFLRTKVAMGYFGFFRTMCSEFSHCEGQSNATKWSRSNTRGSKREELWEWRFESSTAE